MNDNEKSFQQLLWGCRRGMLELDLMLGTYLKDHYDKMTPAEIDAFSLLVKKPDPDIYNWFIHDSDTVDANLVDLVQAIKDYARHAPRN